jgi:hypothetical protein
MMKVVALASMTWKPITTRFKEAEKRFAKHEKLLLREFQVVAEDNQTEHLAECQHLIHLLRNVHLDEDEEKVLQKDQQSEDRRTGKLSEWVG